MNTKLVMSLSALFLAVAGVAITFFPQELSTYIGGSPTALSRLSLQMLGALFFGFAMVNWMAKGAAIGGIYNRPIVIGNFAHFFIGGIALIKAIFANTNLPVAVWVLAGIYTVFAVLFGILFNRHPGEHAG